MYTQVKKKDPNKILSITPSKTTFGPFEREGNPLDRQRYSATCGIAAVQARETFLKILKSPFPPYCTTAETAGTEKRRLAKVFRASRIMDWDEDELLRDAYGQEREQAGRWEEEHAEELEMLDEMEKGERGSVRACQKRNPLPFRRSATINWVGWWGAKLRCDTRYCLQWTNIISCCRVCCARCVKARDSVALQPLPLANNWLRVLLGGQCCAGGIVVVQFAVSCASIVGEHASGSQIDPLAPLCPPAFVLNV
jgi:hypothetical protein